MTFPRTPCLFQQDNARSHSAGVTIVWLCRNRVHVLSPIENVWHIMKSRIRQQQPVTLRNHSVPEGLQRVINRKGDATQW